MIWHTLFHSTIQALATYGGFMGSEVPETGTLSQDSKPEEVRKAWVAALRSGQYEQGKNVLRTQEGKYCCLGVLCELAVKAGLATLAEQVIQGEKYFQYQDYKGDYSLDVLSPFLMAWAGLQVRNGEYSGHDMGSNAANSLALGNDTMNWDFNKIADIIESNPPGLFVKED